MERENIIISFFQVLSEFEPTQKEGNVQSPIRVLLSSSSNSLPSIHIGRRSSEQRPLRSSLRRYVSLHRLRA